jgi:hypothetical protein
MLGRPGSTAEVPTSSTRGKSIICAQISICIMQFCNVLASRCRIFCSYVVGDSLAVTDAARLISVVRMVSHVGTHVGISKACSAYPHGAHVVMN